MDHRWNFCTCPGPDAVSPATGSPSGPDAPPAATYAAANSDRTICAPVLAEK